MPGPRGGKGQREGGGVGGGCKAISEGEREKSLSQFSVFSSSDTGIAGMHLCGLAEATKPGKQVHLYDPSVLVHCPF